MGGGHFLGTASWEDDELGLRQVCLRLQVTACSRQLGKQVQSGE